MIKDALDYLAMQAKASAQPKPLDVTDARAQWFMSPDGVAFKVDKPTSPRSHVLHTLKDLIALADSETGCEAQPCAVFYDRSNVTLILDWCEHRIEKATFQLVSSESWMIARKLGTWLEPKALVRLLRTELRGCLPDAGLVDVIRRVKFENGQTATVETSRTRESLGKELSSKIVTAADVPEWVTLDIPVYSSLGETDRYPLRCSLEIDALRPDAFQLKPFPDELERVQQLAIQSIGDRLKAGLPSGIPAYYGAP